MKRILRALPALMILALLAACVPPQPYPSSASGELFFPTDMGARVEVMPADCLVSGDPCPAPATLSLYPEEWNIVALQWTADGARAVLLEADEPMRHLAILTPPSRQLHRFASLATVAEAAWSPDGRQLAVAGTDGDGQQNSASTGGKIDGSDIFLYSAAGKDLGNLAGSLPGVKSDLTWLSPDRLLFQNYLPEQECNLYVWTISSGALAPWTEPPPCKADPAASPDGAQVAFVRDGNLYLADADGAGAALILDLPADIRRPAWSPNGLWIAFDEIESTTVAVVHPDGSGYQQTGENVHNAGFAPLAGEALLLTAADHPHASGAATASWYTTSIPDGSPHAVAVPGIPPDQMPLNISWRPPQQ